MLATWLTLSLLAPSPATGALPARPSHPVQEAEAAGVQERSLLLHAERLIVRPGEERQDTSILIQGGRIVAIGKGLEAPKGTPRVDGKVVCAGFLDPWSSLGIDGASLEDEGTSFASRATDGLDAFGQDHLQLESLRAGVTAVRVQAGVRARESGVGAVVRNHPGFEGEDAVILADACVGAAVAVERGGRKPDVFDRVGEVDRLVSSIQSGAKYREDWTEYRYELEEWEKAIKEKEEELQKDFKDAQKDRKKEQEKAEEKGKEFKDKKYKEDKRPRAPKYDENNEVMARVAEGELPLIVEIHFVPELRALLEKTAEFERLRLVLTGGNETEVFAEDLARRAIPVILSPEPRREPGERGLSGHNLGLAARLSQAGVKVLFGSGASDPAASRDLPTMVSLAIAHGLDRDAAFAALTVGAAEALDVSDRLGSVQVGKDADLLVLDGEPLATATRVQYVISGGDIVVQP